MNMAELPLLTQLMPTVIFKHQRFPDSQNKCINAAHSNNMHTLRAFYNIKGSIISLKKISCNISINGLRFGIRYLQN